MDGTFLDHLGAYDKARLDNLLDACEAKDYVFTVASGRALLALEELFDGFVDRIAIIAENGALVQYKGEVLFESKLELFANCRYNFIPANLRGDSLVRPSRCLCTKRCRPSLS